MLQWMVEQERCDRSVAAWIFWCSDITTVVKNGGYAAWRSSAAGKIAVTIIDNMRRGLYRSGELRLPEPYRGDLLRMVERWRALPDRMKRRLSDLDLPAALLGPFRAQHNPYVWDLFRGMATSIGRRPGWNNLFNIYLLSDWRLALGAGATLPALIIAFDQLPRL